MDGARQNSVGRQLIITLTGATTVTESAATTEAVCRRKGPLAVAAHYNKRTTPWYFYRYEFQHRGTVHAHGFLKLHLVSNTRPETT